MTKLFSYFILALLLAFPAQAQWRVDHPTVYNVKNFPYNAKGDGSTDDTAAIQSAIATAGNRGGGIVYLPPGTYMVQNPNAPAGNNDLDVAINILVDNVHLRGAGIGATTIKLMDGEPRTHVISMGQRVGTSIEVENISVSHMTIDGNREEITGAIGNNNINVSTGAEKIHLHDLELKNCIYYCIGFQSNAFKDCVVEDVTMTDSGADGIDWKMGTNDSGYGNYIRRVRVLRFGLERATIGVPQAGVNIRRGVNASDIYVAEYSGDNTGLRIDANADDNTDLQQSVVDNVKLVSDGGTGSKGLHTSGKYVRVSNVYSRGAETNYWIRSQYGLYSNLVSVGGLNGIHIFANASDAINYNLFHGAQVSGTTSGGAGIKLSGSGADLVGNTFFNAVLDSNTTSDVSIASGVTDTTFIGGKLASSKVSNSGTNTRFFVAGEMFGPIAFGRNSTQHFLATGDGSGNYLEGVSVSGQAKPTYFDSGVNSGAARLSTRANQPVEFYTNDTARLRLEDAGNAFYPVNDNAVRLGKANLGWSALHLASTVTAGGTTGNQTINKPAGCVNFAASSSSLTVTNSLVSASSVITAMVAANDATAQVKNTVPASGSFAINLAAAATAETKVCFLVVN